MRDFWENMFATERTTWGFEPSESALYVKKFFKRKNIRKILIPGSGYGRNAIPFLADNFQVSGIEISEKAVELANENNVVFPVFNGSVLHMPFSNELYDGIFSYALLHLFNKYERKKILHACYGQLKNKGFMAFTVVSVQADMFGSGAKISGNRYKMPNGLNVFFYDAASIEKEFTKFGLSEYMEIDEPIKHMKGIPPLKCYLIICKKD
jgi:SAM-dependent methyltransferase